MASSVDVLRETATLAFQLSDFLATGHRHCARLDDISRHIIREIVKNNLRPAQPSRLLTARDNRQRARSQSLETQSWPSAWAVDKTAFRLAVVNFEEDTSVYRRRLQEPASTGNTPAPSPESTPPLPPTPSVSSITNNSPNPDSSATTPIVSEQSRHTSQSAEEIIYERPIGPQLPSQPNQSDMANVNDPVIQRIIADAVAAGVRQYQEANPPQRPQQGPPGPPGPPGEPGTAGNGSSKWNPGEIGFFDPNHDNKSMEEGAPPIEYVGKDLYFRDVHLFLEHARDYIPVRGEEQLRTHLWTCLKGRAMNWWLGELGDDGKKLVKLGRGIEEWELKLTTRFKKPTNVAIDAVLKERYTIRDAANHREPHEYAQKILRSAKDAQFTSLRNQLDIIYNGLDAELRRDLRRPKDTTTLEEFMSDLDEFKHDWWTYASRHRPSGGGGRDTATSNRSKNDRPGNYGQYNNRQGYQPNFQRPYPDFYGNNWRNNAYSDQYGRPAYNQGYQNRQNQASNAPRLPPVSERRQITAAHANPEQSNSPFRSNPNAANQGRPAWQNNRGGSKFPMRPKAYHGEVDENKDDPANVDQDEHDEYDESRGTYHTYPDNGENEQYPEDDDAWESQDPEVHFTNPVTTHSCRDCSATFTSKNELFRHLRKEWKEPVQHQAVVKEPDHDEVSDPNPDIHVNVTELDRVEEPRTLISSEYIPPPSVKPGYAFRGFHYVTLTVAIAGQSFKSCLDTGCSMTLIDRALLFRLQPDQKPSKLASPISVRGLGNTMHKTSEYAKLTISIDGKLGSKLATAQISLEAHVVDDLRANMLIGNDVIVPQKMRLDPAGQRMEIGTCRDMVTEIEAVAKSAPVHRSIRTKSTVTIPAMSTASVPVSFQGKQLPDDRDFLFEPQFKGDLGHEGGVYAHIVDSSVSFVQVRNATARPTQLTRRTRLGSIVEYHQAGAYLVGEESAPLAAGGWLARKSKQSWKSRVMKGVAAFAAAAMTLTDSSMRAEVGSLQTATSSMPSAASSTPIVIDPSLEHVMPSGITAYGPYDDAVRIANVANEFPEIWQDTGTTVDIPEEEWMPIPLKPGADPKPSRVYPLGRKDREVVDETLDKMHKEGKMTWSNHPTKYSYPVFVVWRDTPAGRKGRVVVDIRGLNKITELDSYPMPLQTEIINTVAGYRYISTVDATGYFHQFLVKVADRHKLTVVSHRGQEQSNVALMGYKGSPPYVQRQTDKLLRPLRAFAKAYIDDIIIYSKTLEEHLGHLRQLFELCQQKRITLSPKKSYLGYPSVMLLGQRVDSLGLSTSAEKIRAIQALKFPATLRDLEIYLGLTGWLRSSISGYAQIVKPLQERKTAMTRDLPATRDGSKAKGMTRKRQSSNSRVDDPSPEELAAYQSLQAAFQEPVFLIHYDRTRRLYIDLDASKKWGLAAMIYHVKGDPGVDETFARTRVQPIIFLSKLLNAAEMNYWPTELEVAGIVWVVKKIRHLIESSQVPPVVVYTDHSAAVPISKQTTLTTSSTDKLNLRLVRASQYLSSFNLSIRHKAGKSNVVPDALSRLPADTVKIAEQQGVLDVLYGHADIEDLDKVLLLPSDRSYGSPIFHVTLVEMSDDFKSRLRQAYEDDESWKRILHMLRPEDPDNPTNGDRANPDNPGNSDHPETSPSPDRSPNSPTPDASLSPAPQEYERRGIRFKLRDDLLYYTSGDGRERLCIPQALESEVFRMAHDLSSHGGFHRTYDRLVNSVFVRHLARRLRLYIQHCPDCQALRTVRHAEFGSLTPVVTPSIPFHSVALDFVVELPDVDGFNSLLTLTCKFTKGVILIPGRDTWDASTWANAVIVALYTRDWGIPRSFISDRDSKFMSDFWSTIFQKLGVSMLTSTAYHPQTDGQSERTNQSIEIALRYFLSTNPDSTWVAGLPFLSAVHNNSVNFATGYAPNELKYGFRVNDNLNLLEDLPDEDYEKLRQIKRDAADEAISFANTVTKARYDRKHLAIDLNAGDLVYLKLHHGYKIPELQNRKLSAQRTGPFKILEKVGNLAYRLELPPVMSIHPVISVAQLEPVPPGSDPYERPRPDNPPPVEEDGTDAPSYEVERLLDKRTTRGRDQYLVKWRGYGDEHNVWYKVDDLDNAQRLINEYEERQLQQRREPRRRRGRRNG